jgi:chitinase
VFQKDGVDTQLLDGAHCGTMIADIAGCQQNGMKVLLSIAGGFPTDQWLHNDTSAVSFADFLIGAFGKPSTTWTGPRPIGDSHVDGFDFDIESNLFGVNPTYPGVVPAGTTFPDYMSRGYAAMANHIHTSGYLTSSAPQCKIPDAHLSPALSAAWFDYVFVQFYNTPGCSAMDFIQGTGSFNYMSWATASYVNPHTMVYIGLVSCNYEFCAQLSTC